MNYKIEKLDYFGRGIARENGKAIFIENALPNEIVNVNLKEGKYLEGTINHIIEKSPERITPKCPYYGICGGCQTSHMTYNEELKFKIEKVKELFQRNANIDIDPIINETKRFNYRNKVTLKVKEKLGFYKQKTNDIVLIEECILCSNAINKTIKELNKLSLSDVKEVIIRSNYKEEVLLAIKGNIDEEKLKELKDVTTIIYNERIIKGNGYLIDKIGDFLYKVSPESFFQVNREGAKIIYDKVLEYSNLKPNDSLLDLYSGTGTIGIYLSRNCKNVTGIEINKSAVQDAIYNKSLNNASNTEFICNDASKEIKNYKNIDAVVVDPPRSGLSKTGISDLIDLSPKRIIYVSCDPATLARDIKLLSINYNLKNIELINMFPNTYHCESITILERI